MWWRIRIALDAPSILLLVYNCGQEGEKIVNSIMNLNMCKYITSKNLPNNKCIVILYWTNTTNIIIPELTKIKGFKTKILLVKGLGFTLTTNLFTTIKELYTKILLILVIANFIPI